jgi:class 3 adenylate cyclase/tetratricopeptide (TPR) repeat protein
MSAPESPTTVPPPQTPRVPAERAPADGETLEGERKQVTILFADVVGSTAMIQGRDEEDAQRLLDGAVQRMVDAVHRYEGTVSRRMGDGLMAMFGAPVAHEDHAARACFAALAMLESARAYADDARQMHGAEIRIRVGLNSGAAIVRLISDDRHLDYTAMGETVHLASRMEQLAEPGTALLSPSTLALVEGYVEVCPLGPREVNGFDELVEVAELVGTGAARSRLQATTARGLTPFVGREDERAALSRALAQARSGRGQVVAFVADAGVGKSRLVWEATRPERVHDARVLQTGAVSYDRTTAWLPVSGLLRGYFRIESRDDHATMREKVAAAVCALDPALGSGVPALLALLDVPVEDVAWAALDPAQRRLATLDAVRNLLLRESRRQLLLVVFEDLHWIDSESQALLDSLVESLPTTSILLLVNYRPEYSHSWGNKSYYIQLRIDPLDEQNAEKLLAALLGADPSMQPLTSLLIRRTEGTPLFLEESVRSLVETGALVGERGAYRLTQQVDGIRVPATVQAVLAARIDRLPAEDKRLFQTASVIGKDVPYRLLQAIAGCPEIDLQASLSRLQAGELLYPTTLFPELELTFKHALTHDVAYGSLLQARRRATHAQIVAAIERLTPPDRLDDVAGDLAYHGLRGEVWEKARAYGWRAATRARDRSANRAAVAHLEQVVEALAHLPESRGTLEQGIDVRLALRQALQPLSEPRRIAEYLREAEALAETYGDLRRTCLILAFTAITLTHLGEHERAVENGLRARAIAQEVGDFQLQAVSWMQPSEAFAALGEYRQAAAGNRWVMERLHRDQFRERLGMASYPAANSRANTAWPLSELGEFAEAVPLGEEAVRVAETIGHPNTLIQMLAILGEIYLRRGHLERTIVTLERTRVLGRERDVPTPMVWVGSGLALAYAMSGRAEDGVALMEEARELVRASGRLHLVSILAARRSEMYLARGRAEEAAEAAEEALRHARQYKERGNEGWALRALAEAVASREPPDVSAAEEHFRAAIALAESLKTRPLLARSRLGLGKLYRRIGRVDEARAELATASSMLREMEMTFWLPEAEAELAQADAAAPPEQDG